jgi:adenylate kinase family enzyme
MADLSPLCVILIGGTSHAGKSTLAQALGLRLGWEVRSTDKLARHPGRPWATPPKTVKPHVAEHYLSLSGEALLADVLRHYRENVGPQIQETVGLHTASETSIPLVLEGSAILPDQLAALRSPKVAAFWLTASNAFLAQRIHRESSYEFRSPQEKTLIEQFVDRTQRYNTWMVDSADHHGLKLIDVEAAQSAEELVETCLQAASECAAVPAVPADRSARRVVIIGNSGSGKSHLAHALSSARQLPVVELDRLFWQPGSFSEKRPAEEVRASLESTKAQPAWIVEGVFGELAVQVLDRADFLVWLDVDWATCRSSLLRRGFEVTDEAKRPELEASFARLLIWAEKYWTRDGPRSHLGHHQLYEQFHGKKRHFRARADVDHFLAIAPSTRKALNGLCVDCKPPA